MLFDSIYKKGYEQEGEADAKAEIGVIEIHEEVTE